MNKKIIGSFVCMLLIFTVGLSEGFADNTIETQRITIERINDVMPIEPETPLLRPITPVRNTNDISRLPVDIQVTSALEDETHLSCAITGDGNPFVVYDKKYDIATSNLVTQLSIDKGVTWPEELGSEWNFEDTYAINPEISMLSDGKFAFGTYETGEQEPQENMLIYADINDPETWQITYFDRSSYSTYLAETAAATKGENTLAVACICDYGDITDTIVVNWNCYRGEDTWPGVYWGSGDSDLALAHLSGDAGDMIFFCADQDYQTNGHQIKAYYCNVDEATVYSDWKSGQFYSGGNCTYPDVSVSGKLAYVVYMCDKDGSQDVYVATTTNGNYWNKYVVANTENDELYPVISANGNTATCMFTKNNDLYSTKTEDAGKTWSEPVKVNDDAGSVISQYGSLDIAQAYGFWASNRAGNNDIFFEEVGKFAQIGIDRISGGFGLTVTLTNVGNLDAVDVPWSITTDGKLVFLGSEISGTILIPAGGSATISSGFILAIGKVTINITVEKLTKTVSGTALGPFILNVT